MKNNEETSKLFIKYKQYLRLEKGLSDNTIDAYLTDLSKLMRFLSTENIHPLDVTLDQLETFSATLKDVGIAARSQARILSGIRSFYHFLLMEDYLKSDPTELLESSQLGMHLPEVLTVEEINDLIGAIDMTTRRDSGTVPSWRRCIVAAFVCLNFAI